MWGRGRKAGEPAAQQLATVRPRERPVSDRQRLGEALGDANAFVTINDSIHFHPDRTLGGVGFFVVTGPARGGHGPGVYLMDRARREWALAYDVADLPLRQWVRIADWSGVVQPFQLYVIDEHTVAARWLGRGGASVPPGQWDVTGGPTRLELAVAQNEHAMIMDSIRRM